MNEAFKNKLHKNEDLAFRKERAGGSVPYQEEVTKVGTASLWISR